MANKRQSRGEAFPVVAAGGITFAQDETSAKYATMPRSATAARCVDFVLPPEKIGREILRIVGHPYVTPGHSERRMRFGDDSQQMILLAIEDVTETRKES